MKSISIGAYVVVIVLNAGLAALAVQLDAGNAPVPVEYRWFVPVIVAMLTALTALLPSLKRE